MLKVKVKTLMKIPKESIYSALLPIFEEEDRRIECFLEKLAKEIDSEICSLGGRKCR